MGEFVRLEVKDGVATLRIDRPKMNALNAQVQEEIRTAAEEASTRDDVRAVVVYGGDRVFAAGADIKEMADMCAPGPSSPPSPRWPGSRSPWSPR